MKLAHKIIDIEKADLHVHFEGSVSHETLTVLAKRHGVDLHAPAKTTVKLPYMPSRRFADGHREYDNFSEFIGGYLKVTECIKTSDDVVLLCNDYAKSCKAQGITHSEIYFTPATFSLFETDLDELYNGLVAGQTLATSEFGTTFSWIFDIARNAPHTAEPTFQEALLARDKGVHVKAFGLAGDETAEKAVAFKDVFSKAASCGFTPLVHAGELLGAESIWDALRLNPRRIGHGVTVLDDQTLVEKIKREQIPLEVSPWSNIRLSIYKEDNHPIIDMLSNDLPVVLCSDDPGMFAKSLLDNFQLLHLKGVSEDSLLRLAAFSLKCRS